MRHREQQAPRRSLNHSRRNLTTHLVPMARRTQHRYIPRRRQHLLVRCCMYIRSHNQTMNSRHCIWPDGIWQQKHRNRISCRYRSSCRVDNQCSQWNIIKRGCEERTGSIPRTARVAKESRPGKMIHINFVDPGGCFARHQDCQKHNGLHCCLCF